MGNLNIELKMIFNPHVHKFFTKINGFEMSLTLKLSNKKISVKMTCELIRKNGRIVVMNWLKLRNNFFKNFI